MTVIDIRNQIIQKLQEINDISFLEAVKTIIDSKSDKEVFYINDEMEQKLLERRSKIANGNLFKNDTVFKEAEEWLEGK